MRTYPALAALAAATSCRALANNKTMASNITNLRTPSSNHSTRIFIASEQSSFPTMLPPPNTTSAALIATSTNTSNNANAIPIQDTAAKNSSSLTTPVNAAAAFGLARDLSIPVAIGEIGANSEEPESISGPGTSPLAADERFPLGAEQPSHGFSELLTSNDFSAIQPPWASIGVEHDAEHGFLGISNSDQLSPDDLGSTGVPWDLYRATTQGGEALEGDDLRETMDSLGWSSSDSPHELRPGCQEYESEDTMEEEHGDTGNAFYSHQFNLDELDADDDSPIMPPFNNEFSAAVVGYDDNSTAIDDDDVSVHFVDVDLDESYSPRHHHHHHHHEAGTANSSMDCGGLDQSIPPGTPQNTTRLSNSASELASSKAVSVMTFASTSHATTSPIPAPSNNTSMITLSPSVDPAGSRIVGTSATETSTGGMPTSKASMIKTPLTLTTSLNQNTTSTVKPTASTHSTNNAAEKLKGMGIHGVVVGAANAFLWAIPI